MYFIILLSATVHDVVAKSRFPPLFECKHNYKNTDKKKKKKIRNFFCGNITVEYEVDILFFILLNFREILFLKKFTTSKKNRQLRVDKENEFILRNIYFLFKEPPFQRLQLIFR